MQFTFCNKRNSRLAGATRGDSAKRHLRSVRGTRLAEKFPNQTVFFGV
jgi:hypothetical protein